MTNKTPTEPLNATETAFLAEMRAARTARAEIREQAVPALLRLFSIAKGDSGQCGHVAAFLLSLYNGSRFTFDLTDFRSLDREIFDDCMLVLKMDAMPEQEVHCYIKDGQKQFEELAKNWLIPDRVVLKNLISKAEFSGYEAPELQKLAKRYLDSRRY